MLKDKSILLGVSGGIAAYKAAELVRWFIKAEASVQVVMTANARQFITPLTLQALSGQPVLTNLFNLEKESRIGHIHAARSADLVVLAPATANLIAKMASGIADDYLTTILLATTAPVLICPAMNAKMYEHPVTQRNLSTLKGLGYHILPPAIGSLACKEEGAGRLAEIADIIEASRRSLTPSSLAGRRLLVSAGPTWEPFDPVRFISNPSTGKMGYALAAVAARRSADVHLISGPSALCAPQGVKLNNVVTAREMKEAVLAIAPEMDAIIMAAAVSDFRPTDEAAQKIKKIAGEEAIRLSRNPDILATLGQSRPGRKHQILVGFAAETENLIENAREKLIEKNLDFIVANNLTQYGSGFGSDTNQVKILDRDGNITELPCLTKEEVAGSVLDRVEKLLEDRGIHGTDLGD
jgi:phosphopantothenoylcysteine decarboxylase / phosphopantothenate---cysteine ligase